MDIGMELRRNSKSEFDKTLFKLMKNALYQRTLMNPDRHKDMEMVFNSEINL